MVEVGWGGRSQSILVSEESEAGKTESTKNLMQYLAYMGGRPGSNERSVAQQVLEVCYIYFKCGVTVIISIRYLH